MPFDLFSKWFCFARDNYLAGQGQRPFWLICGLSFALGHVDASETNSIPPKPFYEIRAEHDPNGIGKFYLGREIADVMGHQAAEQAHGKNGRQPTPVL